MTVYNKLAMDRHYEIGPLAELGEHGPVIGMADTTDGDGFDVYACLDCGFVTDDRRQFHTTACERGENGISQTLREYIEKHGGLPTVEK